MIPNGVILTRVPKMGTDMKGVPKMGTEEHIFRIENPRGEGLYMYDPYRAWIMPDSGLYSTPQRPSPNKDMVISPLLTKSHYFGFRNIQQIEDWLGESNILRMADYPSSEPFYAMSISVYRGSSESIIHGQKQSIMLRQLCTKIDIIQGKSVMAHHSYGQAGYHRDNFVKERYAR